MRGRALGALAGEPRWVASIGALLDAVDAYPGQLFIYVLLFTSA